MSSLIHNHHHYHFHNNRHHKCIHHQSTPPWPPVIIPTVQQLPSHWVSNYRRPLFELHWCCWWIFKLHCICISTLVLDCLCIPGQNFWCISGYSIDAMLIFCICICIIALNCILCPLYFQTLNLHCQPQLSNIIILSPIDSLCNTGMVEVYFVLWWNKLWFWTFCCVFV